MENYLSTFFKSTRIITSLKNNMKTDRYSVAILVADDSGTILYPSNHFFTYLFLLFDYILEIRLNVLRISDKRECKKQCRYV